MLNDEQIAEAQRVALEENLKDPEFRRGYERMDSLLKRAEGHDAAVQRAEQAEAALAEMTRLRDNALRAAAHADQSIDVDLDGIIGDGISDLGIDWDEGVSQDWFAAKVVAFVRPVVAHATKRAEQAEAETKRLTDERDALLTELTALMDTIINRLPAESRIRVRLAEIAVLGIGQTGPNLTLNPPPVTPCEGPAGGVNTTKADT